MTSSSSTNATAAARTTKALLTTLQKLSTGVDARNIRNIVLMRPINSIIEFKQIIGRGTRLYDGKDYFTIYDFVKAHQHFNDPEWDGEPEGPEACERCGQRPCVCEKQPPKLLEGLAEKGFGSEQMAEMQRIIDTEKSDLFDVLAYVAYALPTQTREQRANMAKVQITAQFNDKQQAFLAIVLGHYVNEGVQELDQDKLMPLLRLKYNNSIADAIADLGRPEEIGKVFTDFQQYLYQGAV